MAKKKKQEEKPKSYVETCAPKQNGCTKAGTGPNCLDSGANGLVNDGANAKRDCLKEAKKYCEDKLETCLKECEEVRKTNRQELKDLSGAASRNLGTRMYCNQDDITNGLGIYQSPASQQSYISFHTPYRWRLEHAECVKYCFRQAATDCSTVQCFCDQFKCTVNKPKDETPDKTPDAIKDEDDVTKTPSTDYTSNTTNSASFATTSAYNIPIEIVYSRAFMPGNVIWFGPVVTDRTTTTRTSYDPSTNTNRTVVTLSVTNLVDLVLGVCAGEIGDIVDFYVNGRKTTVPYDVQKGSSAQKVLKEHAEDVGFGYAPAYRDVALLVLRDFDVTPYTQFPTLKIEVISNSSDDPFVVETVAQTGLDSQNIWAVDPVAGRVFYEAVNKVRSSKYETLETVWDELTSNAIEVTPIGNLITKTAGSFYVYHPHLSEEYGGYVARATNKTFLFPTEAMSGESYLGLFTFDSAGALYVEKVDEVRGEISAGVSIPAFDTAAPKCAFKQTYNRTGVAPGTLVEETSAFFLRVKEGTPDTIRVNELRMVSGDSGGDFLENGEKYTYDLPTSYFSNTTSLVLKGAVPVADSSMLIFASFGSVNRIIKWNPRDGRLWSTDVASLPDFGKYGQVRVSNASVFAYVAPDDETYIVDVANGDVTQYDDSVNLFPGLLDGKQYFDSETNSITYHSEDSKITRIFLDRTSTENVTMKDVIEDVCLRSGIDLLYVDASALAIREVVGFRSGENTLGAEILYQLSRVYPSVITTADKVLGRPRNSTVGGAIDSEHYKTIPTTLQQVVHKEDPKVAVTYFSNASTMNGDLDTQATKSGSESLDAQARLCGSPGLDTGFLFDTLTYMTGIWVGKQSIGWCAK